MANRTINDLQAISEIATGDLLPIYDISEATNLETKKISIQQLDTRYQTFNPISTPVGEMYQVDNAVVTTISTQDVYVQIGNFTEGETNLVTYASNQLTVSNSGDYLLIASIDAIGGAVASKDFTFVARVNGTAVTKTQRERSLVSASSGAMSVSGILALSADDVVDIAVKNTTDTTDLTIINCNLSIHGI